VKLRIDRALRCEDDTAIPAGTYEVELDEDGSTVVLTRDGAQIAAPAAVLRPAKRAVRKPKVELRDVADAPRRLLVARTRRRTSGSCRSTRPERRPPAHVTGAVRRAVRPDFRG
jgi:hypothetical protein